MSHQEHLSKRNKSSDSPKVKNKEQAASLVELQNMFPSKTNLRNALLFKVDK